MYDCNSEAINKCQNCIKMNESRNLVLDVNHMANSKMCPVYTRKIEEKKKRIGHQPLQVEANDNEISANRIKRNHNINNNIRLNNEKYVKCIYVNICSIISNKTEL